MFATKFRESLDAPVADEFDHLTSSVNGFLKSEHNDDGSHSDIEPDSLTLDSGVVGRWQELTFDASRFATGTASIWTVTSDNQNYFRMSRVGQIVHMTFAFETTDISVAAANALYVFLPEVHGVPHGKTTQVYQRYIAGQGEWYDGAAGTSGLFSTWALIEQDSTHLRTSLFFQRISPTNATMSQWPVSNDLSIFGTVTFPCLPDNQPVVYSFT